MDWKFKVVLRTMSVLLCGLWLSHAASGQALPDGKGKAEFVHNCTACHTAKMVTRVKKTPDEWKINVREMAARGTDGTPEDLDNVVLYLDANFSTDKPDAAAGTPASAATGSVIAPALIPAEIDAAKRVISENGCLSCHRVEQQGMYTGPSLNGVAARRTPDEIRRAIVAPPATLHASNDLVRLTTADGTTVSGRILSQDNHTVQVIDPSGRVTAYAKSELRQLTVITTNPMPSFEGKIAGENLDGLVRFLDSLPAIDPPPSADQPAQK